MLFDFAFFCFDFVFFLFFFVFFALILRCWHFESSRRCQVLLPTILADKARGEMPLNLLRVPNSPHRLVRQLQAPARDSMKQQIRQSARPPSMLREAFLALESIKRDGDARGLNPPPGPPKVYTRYIQASFAVSSYLSLSVFLSSFVLFLFHSVSSLFARSLTADK